MLNALIDLYCLSSFLAHMSSVSPNTSANFVFINVQNKVAPTGEWEPVKHVKKFQRITIKNQHHNDVTEAKTNQK